MPPNGWRHDDASRERMRTAWIARLSRLPSFWDRVDATGDCWEWTGSLATAGYGACRVDGSHRLAHRRAYELLVGPIPAGMQLDHLCRNHLCVNPDHLEVVTEAVNIRRGYSPTALNARKTHCKHGHEFTAENTGRARYGRYCRTCKRATWREWDQRRRAA